MKLDLENSLLNDKKNNKSVKNFIEELKNYFEKGILSNNYKNTKMEDTLLTNRK